MVNLKIVKEKENRWVDYLESNEVYTNTKVLNLDTKKYVKDEKGETIHAENEEDRYTEGLEIVKVNGECKAIVKWEIPFCDKTLNDDKIIENEIMEINGRKKYSVDDILSLVKKVTVYNTDGKKLFETQRDYDDFNSFTFKIKFGEKTVTCLEIESILPKEQKIYKNVYSYEGEKLFSKKQILTNEEILDKINTNDNELTR